MVTLSSIKQKSTFIVLGVSVVVGVLAFSLQRANSLVLVQRLECNGVNRVITVGEYENLTGTKFNSGVGLELVQGNAPCTFTFNGTMDVDSLFIGNGVTLTHGDNVNIQNNTLTVNAANDIVVEAGGSINVDGKGYDGSKNGANGYGPGGGTGRSQYGFAGTGGAHAGDGGSSSNGGLGGAAYCNINNPNTLGSGGGAGRGAKTEGNGGGLIRLISGRDVILDGTLSAKGTNAASATSGAGGGAGGAVYISAQRDLDAGDVTIDVSGGNAGHRSGAGGGGCVSLHYVDDGKVNVSNVIAYGGKSYDANNRPDSDYYLYHGGAGVVFVKKLGTNGDVYVSDPSESSKGDTRLGIGSFEYDTVTLNGGVLLNVPSGSTYSLRDVDPIKGDGEGSFNVFGTLSLPSIESVSNVIYQIRDGGVLNINSISSLDIAESGGLVLFAGATVNTANLNSLGNLTSSGYLLLDQGANFGIGNLTLNGGTMYMSHYTPDESLVLTSLTVEDGATLKAIDNIGTEVVHMVNITAGSINIKEGGHITVDGQGYPAVASGSTYSGYGQGGIGAAYGGGTGSPGSSVNAVGGGGHAGKGGDGTAGSGGPRAGGERIIVDLSEDLEIVSLGGGGGSNQSGKGGDGGGLIKLNSRGVITVDGIVSANGATTTHNSTGGGAGGGIWLIGRTIQVSGSLSAVGGDGLVTGAAGGGGAILVGSVENDIQPSNYSISQGSGGGTAAEVGQYFAYDITPPVECHSLHGASFPISAANINEGEFDFDALVGTDLESYGACIYEQENYGQTRLGLYGWVWNTNLGWFSLASADDGEGNNINSGILTGDVEYQSYIDLEFSNGSIVSGQLRGYWWGDNMGWLRLNCDLNGYPGETGIGFEDDYCSDTPGITDHGVGFDANDIDFDSGIATLSGYAWSDSLGWVDMAGVEIPLGDLVQDIDVAVNIVKVQGDTSGNPPEVLTGNSLPVSDGLGGYLMLLTFIDQAGNNMSADFYDNDSGLDFSFVFEDNRHLGDDAVVDSGSDIVYSNANCSAANFSTSNQTHNLGLPDKLITKEDFEYRDGASGFVAGGSRMSAPIYGEGFTASELGDEFDEYDPGEQKVIYMKDFDCYVRSFVPVEGSRLSLKAVNISKVEDGVVVYDKSVPVSYNFRFDPPFNLNMFQGRLNEAYNDVKSGFVNVANAAVPEGCFDEAGGVLDINLGFNSPISLCGEFFSGVDLSPNFDVSMNYEFDDLLSSDIFDVKFFSSVPNLSESDVEISDLDGLGNPFNFFMNNSNLSSFSVFPYFGLVDQDVEEAEVDIKNILSSANITTRVIYDIPTGQTVNWEGPSLGKSNFNVSAANLSGNIQSGAFEQLQSGGSVRDSGRGGNVRSNTRLNILRQLNEIIRGVLESRTTNLGCIYEEGDSRYNPAGFNIETCDVRGEEKIYIIRFDKDYGQHEYIKMSDLDGWVRNGADPTGAANRTLVVIGADVIIDKDIYYSDSEDVSGIDVNKATGIVVFKDINNRGGNVYITSDVSDLRVHVFADGSVFSVDTVDSALNSGESGRPNRVGENLDKMRSQLAIAGQIVSQNTVGGASQAPFKSAGGVLTTSFEEARDYDVNFWRYSPLQYKVVRIVDAETGEADLFIQPCGEFSESEDEEYIREGFNGALIDYTEFFDGDVFNSVQRQEAICWPSDGKYNGVAFRESRYMNEEQGQGSQAAYERSVVNIIFESAPEELPLF